MTWEYVTLLLSPWVLVRTLPSLRVRGESKRLASEILPVGGILSAAKAYD
ncbi:MULTISPECIES: hypothetical protein [unclassified Microcoleus]|nr:MULTISPECIES: hypothetical protein [unclassified Microcoleus]